jgi:hypothetical protein
VTTRPRHHGQRQLVGLGQLGRYQLGANPARAQHVSTSMGRDKTAIANICREAKTL